MTASYSVTTRIFDETAEFQKPIDDPFVRHTVTIGWQDLLRALVTRRRLEVTTIVAGNRDAHWRVFHDPEQGQPLSTSGRLEH